MNPLKQFDINFISEKYINIAGVDEAGRGPLAGPVVAAAVIFDTTTFIEGVNDSKKIAESKREDLAEKIKEKSIDFAYGIVDHQVIDDINILQATFMAMKNAVQGLQKIPNLILIDGNKSFFSEIPTKTIVKGDSKSFSIASASILAKVKRDEIMKSVGELYPNYLWHKNKGYGTKEHISAIRKFGPTKLHRQSFLSKILHSYEQEELL